MLPSLREYVIALLRILNAAAPASKPTTNSFDIETEMLPEKVQ